MDHIRNLIATNKLGSSSGGDRSDSGIECCTTTSLSSQQNLQNQLNSDTMSAIDLSDDHISENILLDDHDDGDHQLVEELNDDKKQNVLLLTHHLSSDSGSTFEILEAPDDQWNNGDEELRGAALFDDERDNFSPENLADSEVPINNNLLLETIQRITDTAAAANELATEGDNNKNLLRNANRLCDRGRLSSKEEKQRQNEEIVIMESSSVSSEAGSWESVFPQRQLPTTTTVDCYCTQYTKCDKCLGTNVVDPVVVDDIEFTYIPPKTVSAPLGACFIDASSLLDETELAYCSSPKITASCPPSMVLVPQTLNLRNEASGSAKHMDEISTKPKENEDFDNLKSLETFHRDFELCKVVNLKNSENNSVTATPDLKSPNLSDEQKLLHRDADNRSIDYDIKDQFSSDSSTDQKMFCPPPTTTTTMDGSLDETKDISAYDEIPPASAAIETSKSRQEQERKQGNFLFKNSIQHYSGHVMSPAASKLVYTSDRDDHYCSDASLPSLYSTTSEPAFCGGSKFQNFTDSYYNSNNSVPYSQLPSELSDYPDTPHNSIINIDLPQNKSQIPSDDSNETPTCAVKIPKKALKYDDSAPIISGGASIKDFSPKLCESPRRRSGGEGGAEEDRPSKFSSINTWVVDMSSSQSRTKRLPSDSSSSSNCTTDNTTTSMERSGSSSSHKSGGLGFYVSLNDMKVPKRREEDLERTTTTKCFQKSTGFYVDFSDTESSRVSTPPPTAAVQQSLDSSAEKKNIFSIFIDIGEKKQVEKKEPLAFTSRLATSIQRQKDLKSNQSNGCDNTSDAVVCRRSHSPAKVGKHVSEDVKRHSWNASAKLDEKLKVHTRSSSLSNDNGIMSILDKIPLISKTSSLSIDSPNSPFDDFTCSKSLSSYSNNSNSLTSANSIHSSIENKTTKPEADVMTTSRKRRQDAKINETFDKSSQGSLTDDILSKDSSPTTDTDDITFQNDLDVPTANVEHTADVPPSAPHHPMMETIIEQKEVASPKKQPHTMESLQATIEKQKLLLETVNEEVQLSSFVKLSDMDKPAAKFEISSNDTLSKSAGSTSRIGRLFGDSLKSSGNRASWHTMSRSTGNNLTNLASSVENLKSLSRLFPHLSKELSNSLPADIEINYFNHRLTTINDEYTAAGDYVQTDLSSASSLTSSFSRSGIDSADESSLSCRQPRRLGEDLLKMFLQEIATDVVVEVDGRRMRAHKCILRSRCQYFAAILAGGWVQSAGNVILLPGYSYGSVHFALCHIYSGASYPPEGISLMELSALADLLGLEGLKEVTAHALRTNYCHNFHKPCSGCIEGILQVFPITLNHGLDELYRKCLRWVCKHYLKVWSTRAFAQLPADLIGRCKQHVVAHLTSESVIQALLDCDNLLSLIAPCRWAIGVENTVRDIIDTAHAYISDHFASLIASDGFLSLGHGQSWNISRLENVLLRIAATLTPDQACRSYQRVTRLNAVLGAKILKISPTGSRGNNDDDNEHQDEHEEEMDWNSEFLKLVSAILSAVEQCLTRQCGRAMRNIQWQRMDLDLRKKIQKLACLSDPVETRRSQSLNKPLTYNSVPIHNNNRSQDLHQVKLAIQAHSKRTQEIHYQQQQQQHQPYHRAITQTTDRGIQANHEPRSIERGYSKVLKTTSRAHVPDLKSQSSERRTISMGHRRSQSETINTKVNMTHEETKKSADLRPRYLEPPRAVRHKSGGSDVGRTNQHVISSSDESGSTRNSSPANKNYRPIDGNKLQKKTATAKKSENAISRDSLASPAKSAITIGTTKTNRQLSGIDLSNDSLGGSMHSSIKTEKTLSQESLKCAAVKKPQTKRELLLVKPANTQLRQNIQSRSNPMINKDATRLKKYEKNKSVSCQSTNENSPSSVTTNRSSHLTSATSAVSSPRDGYKNRSISLNQTTQQLQQPVRRSFLSARSKEILSKKQNLNQSASTKSVPGYIRDKSTTQINKSNSTSNVVSAKRPTSFNTTLHLRRTAKLPETSSSSSSSIAPRKSSQPTKITANNIKNEKMSKKEPTPKSITTKLIIKPIDNDAAVDHDEKIRLFLQQRESKLERSSTFCKEPSDIPTGELQIIE